MLCKSGATHNMFSDMMFFAYRKFHDKHLEVSWGDSSTSHSLGTRHLIFLGYFPRARSGRGVPLKGGTDDALLVPDCTRSLCSLPRFSAQGHTVHLNEMNPCIVLRDGKKALYLAVWSRRLSTCCCRISLHRRQLRSLVCLVKCR